MVSKRIAQMTPSATNMLTGRVSDMKSAGIDVISFNVGEPDFPTPQPVIDSCCGALNTGRTKYEAVGGIQPLRESICKKL